MSAFFGVTLRNPFFVDKLVCSRYIFDKLVCFRRFFDREGEISIAWQIIHHDLSIKFLVIP